MTMNEAGIFPGRETLPISPRSQFSLNMASLSSKIVGMLDLKIKP